MKILYNCQDGGGWDQRCTTRDVSVVTRQPLLKAFVEAGHKIVFPARPAPPEEISEDFLARDPLLGKLYDLNKKRVKEIEGSLEIVPLEEADCDFAITELRTRLYFHESRPLDVLRQDYIWKRFPTIIWDMDLWLGDELSWFPDPKRAFYSALVVTPASRYSYYSHALSDRFDIDLPWRHFDFAVDSEAARLVKFNPSPPYALGYVGSQYNREDAFSRFYIAFAQAHPNLKLQVIGHWYPNVMSRTPKNIEFSIERTPMFAAPWHFNQYLATLQIAPKYYQIVGQHTYRFYEGRSYGALLLCDGAIADFHHHISRKHMVSTPNELAYALNEVSSLGPQEREELHRTQLDNALKEGNWRDRAEFLVTIGERLGEAKQSYKQMVL